MNLHIEPSPMYTGWVKFYIPSTKDIIYADVFDYAAEQEAIEHQLQEAKVEDYKLVHKHHGFVIHCHNEEVANQISTAINLQDRQEKHRLNNLTLCSQ
ncbi:MAG: hypothetical protein P8P30_03940 [Rickettsiales bacterium]|nr:hypothetical protein [Rickettsiales bacterium]